MQAWLTFSSTPMSSWLARYMPSYAKHCEQAEGAASNSLDGEMTLTLRTHAIGALTQTSRIRVAPSCYSARRSFCRFTTRCHIGQQDETMCIIFLSYFCLNIYYCIILIRLRCVFCFMIVLFSITTCNTKIHCYKRELQHSLQM